MTTLLFFENSLFIYLFEGEVSEGMLYVNSVEGSVRRRTKKDNLSALPKWQVSDRRDFPTSMVSEVEGLPAIHKDFYLEMYQKLSTV